MINLIVVERSGVGGSASYLYSFLKYLNRKEFQPVLVLHHPVDSLAIREIEKLGIEIVYLFKKYVDSSKESIDENTKQNNENNDRRPRLSKVLGYLGFILNFAVKDLPEMLRFYNILRKTKVDLIVFNAEVHFFKAEILLAKIVKIPCLVRKSGIGYRHSSKIAKILSSFVNVFVAISEAERQKHIQAGYPYKKMFTVYNGVDTREYCSGMQNTKIRDEFGIKSEKRIIGLISRIDYGKGHLDVIRAAKIVVDKIPDVIFFIVGDDVTFNNRSFRIKIENEVKKLNLEDYFIFAGWRDDIPDILHSIDIFVHCPNEWREALGVATLEALACGKPLVVTDNDGLAETTIDGFNGFIVPKGDHNAIAQKIILLLNDAELRKRMSHNSRKRAEDIFDIRKNIRIFEQIMLENLNN